MPKVSYRGLRNGFPFVIPKNAEDGNAVEVWDGTTRYGGLPSKSATANITVVGPGTPWPVKMKRDRLAEIYWRVRKCRIDCTQMVLYLSGTPRQIQETRDWYCQNNTDATTGPISESELVVTNYHNNNLAGDVSLLTLYGTSYGISNVWFAVFTSQATAYYDADADYVWVSFGFSISQSGLTLSTQKPQDVTGYSIIDGPLLRFYGEDVQTWLKFLSQATAGHSGTMEIIPIEWRDYGGTWDTATGQPILP